MPVSIPPSSTAGKHRDIEERVAAETEGLSVDEVEMKVETASTEYDRARRGDGGGNSESATKALMYWALMGARLDSMRGPTPTVSPMFKLSPLVVIRQLTARSERIEKTGQHCQ